MSSSNLSELNNIEKANQDYLHGLEYLQTSCIKCRCNPDYLDAIPFFKKAAELYRGCGQFEKEVQTREKLVRCFNNEKSYWEEGNEYQKMCQTQINQLKQINEAKNSIINSFNAFAANRTYSDGIKALTKASNFFIDNGNKEEAEQILEFAFEGIGKYYHVLIINEEETHHYIYECIDKYIDLLFDKEKFNKSANVAEKAAEIIKEENEEEKNMICKYYGFWALSELVEKHNKKYQEIIDKGMDFEKDGNDFCSKINRLVNVINQKSKDNEKLIKKIYSEIARNVPSSMARVVNIKYVQVNIVKAEDEINTNNNDEEEDMK